VTSTISLSFKFLSLGYTNLISWSPDLRACNLWFLKKNLKIPHLVVKKLFVFCTGHPWLDVADDRPCISVNYVPCHSYSTQIISPLAMLQKMCPMKRLTLKYILIQLLLKYLKIKSSVFTKMYHDLKTYLGAKTKIKFCSDTKHDKIFHGSFWKWRLNSHVIQYHRISNPTFHKFSEA
jgi:hypothetical protein